MMTSNTMITAATSVSVNRLMHNDEYGQTTLKILRCSQQKIYRVCLAISHY